MKVHPRAFVVNCFQICIFTQAKTTMKGLFKRQLLL